MDDIDRAAMNAPAPVMWKPNPVLKWVRIHFLEPTLWRLPMSERILDLCCGYGFYFSINSKAQGVDGDPVCVNYLRAQGFSVQQCDIRERLPFPDGHFEYVIAHDVLEHFTYEDLVAIFAEVHRVLRADGRFVVWVPNRMGYDYGIRKKVGHQLFVTRKEIDLLRGDQFNLSCNYAEPLPRWLGEYFKDNKEVFELVKRSGS